jgi:cell division protein FtsZ
MRDIGYSIVAFGEGEGLQKSKDCIELALGNPLLDVDINGAMGALINITGGIDLKLEDAHNVVKYVMDATGQNAKMKWGVQIDNNLKNKIKVMAIITGIPRQRFEKYFDFESYKHDYNIDIISNQESL